MNHWVCLTCSNKNQENMKFCPICHQPRLRTEAHPAEQRTAPPPFPYQTDTPAEQPMPFPFPMEPQEPAAQPAEPLPRPAADAAPQAVFAPARDRGRTLRIILIAANAACLVLNIAGIVILLR